MKSAITTRPLVECHRNEPWIASDVVARKFKVKHRLFLRSIEVVRMKLAKSRGLACPPKFRFEERTYRGQTYDVCLMNRPAFALVSMRFESQVAFAWQLKFVDQFFDMEHALADARANRADPGWLAGRTQGKITRRATTDAIADFVDYAKAQGSRNAAHYYSNLTKATYRALGMVQSGAPSLRDTLDGVSSAQLLLAEDAARKLLRRRMAEGIDYHEIYAQTAADLQAFCAGFSLGDADGSIGCAN